MQNAERKYKIQNTKCTSNTWFLAKNSEYKIRKCRIQDEWRMILKYSIVNRVIDKKKPWERVKYASKIVLKKVYQDLGEISDFCSWVSRS